MGEAEADVRVEGMEVEEGALELVQDPVGVALGVFWLLVMLRTRGLGPKRARMSNRGGRTCKGVGTQLLKGPMEVSKGQWLGYWKREKERGKFQWKPPMLNSHLHLYLRLLRDTTPIQRGIIRHLILILDLSTAMSEKDFRPSRYLLTLKYTQEFVTEFFEQNPISQLGIMGMRDGLAVRISDMSGNPNDHLSALAKLKGEEPKGNPSLQNALEMARGALFHAPSHGTREVLVVFGALLTSDPGDIHLTITSLVKDKIRVSVVGLAAQIAVCRELVTRTNNGSDTGYTIPLNESHYRDLLLSITTPPVTRSTTIASSTLLQMGFPSRIVENTASLCACHSKLTKGGYLCSRCKSKVCALPAECPACGLTLILSTHLARSYHHLFPLKNWEEVPWKQAGKSSHCFACLLSFPANPSLSSTSASILETPSKNGSKPPLAKVEAQSSGTSPSSRYMCSVCQQHFCIDCDVFAHEVVHNCPGCNSLPPPAALDGQVKILVDGEMGAVDAMNHGVHRARKGKNRGEQERETNGDAMDLS
jgi:transcription initiation factor TFIIH subunit 2